MARRLIDRNRQREARRQRLLLDRLAGQFRPILEREIAAAMADTVERWEQAQIIDLPRAFPDRLAVIYRQMAEASVRAFGGRILEQGKAAGLVLEHKLIDFGVLMTNIALSFISQEAMRRRIQRVTETTRRQIVTQVENGYREGLPTREIGQNIRSVIPAIARWRADTIARTETHAAANFGSTEAARATNLPLRREWLAAHDDRTRTVDPVIGDADLFGHREADGQIVGMDEPFLIRRLGGGTEALRYPGDPNGSPGNVVNCFAPWSTIHLGGLKGAMRRDYVGDLIELSVGGPVDLAVTPNHPVLTERGWVAASKVVEGEKLFKCRGGNEIIAGMYPEIADGFAKVEKLYDLAQSLSGGVRPRCVDVNLHGEIIAGHDVDVVAFKGDLLATCDTPELQILKHFTLAESDIPLGQLLALRMKRLGDSSATNKSSGSMGRFGAGEALFRAQEPCPTLVSFRNAGSGDAQIIKATVYDAPRNTKFFSNAVDGVPFREKPLDGVVIPQSTGHVPLLGNIRLELVTVTHIRRFHYSGPVYNFESTNGLLISDNIITHNCRCTVAFLVDDGLDDEPDPYENPAALS